MQTVQQSLQAETKSSAGDKYETAREMLKQELDKNAAQLAETIKQRQLLLSINTAIDNNIAQQGALVVTNRGEFYISTGLGQVKIGNETFVAVSASSPIAKQMLGKTVNDKFVFNGTEYTIQSII